MTTVTTNPVNHAGWNEMILNGNDYTFFHSSNWARTLNESYGFTPVYFGRFDNGGVTALIPVMEVCSFLTGRRGVSLPFSDFCDFVGSEEPLKEVLEAVLTHGRERGWKYVDFRSNHRLFQQEVSFRQHYSHTLDLSAGIDRIYRDMRDSTKRNIKKAVKEGATVTNAATNEGMAEFCRLNSMTRRLHGIPPQPAAFLERFYGNVIKAGMGRIYLAHYRGVCIAAAVFVRFGDRVMYKYGASDLKYQHLRGNNLVMWQAIRDYCAEGGAIFSFGRTEPDNDGLRQFKNGWGCKEETVRYHRFNLQRNMFERDDSDSHAPSYTKILSRLPIPLLKTIGKYMYRHVG